MIDLIDLTWLDAILLLAALLGLAIWFPILHRRRKRKRGGPNGDEP